MDTIQSNHHADDELEAMLDEESLWTIVSTCGSTMSFAGNLRAALVKAADYSGSSGAEVASIARLPFDSIVIPLDQIERLGRRLLDREVALK